MADNDVRSYQTYEERAYIGGSRVIISNKGADGLGVDFESAGAAGVEVELGDTTKVLTIPANFLLQYIALRVAQAAGMSNAQETTMDIGDSDGATSIKAAQQVSSVAANAVYVYAVDKFYAAENYIVVDLDNSDGEPAEKGEYVFVGIGQFVPEITS